MQFLDFVEVAAPRTCLDLFSVVVVALLACHGICRVNRKCARVVFTASERSSNTRITHSAYVMHARGISEAQAPQLRAAATLDAMCFTLTLLLGTVGVLITRGKDPNNSEEVREMRMELSLAYAEIASLKTEIGRLKKELDACAEGHL